jgi:hypothetical protein
MDLIQDQGLGGKWHILIQMVVGLAWMIGTF